MHGRVAATSTLFLALVSSGAAQKTLAPEETSSCDAADGACEGDDVVDLLQRNLIKESRLSSSSTQQALHAAMDAVEVSQEREDWVNPFKRFSKFHCRHAKQKNCPQIKCDPIMVNTTCSNDALGTGRETCGACRADELSYHLVRVKTSDIPTEMSIPGPGSSIPEELQGVWWMDQFGQSVGTDLLSCDPNYQYDFPHPSTELALTFGDTAVWNPETQCVEWRIYYGGEKGSWSWLDESGTGSNKFWIPAHKAGTVMMFCKTAAATPTYEIHIKIRFPADSLFIPIFKLLDFKRLPDGYWLISDKPLGSFTMEKTCFGWDRVTRATGDENMKVRNFLSKYFPFLRPILNLNPTDGSVGHYPVFQIVDGRGRKTSNWDAFYQWATVTSVKMGKNKGGDTLLLGRPKSS